MIRPPLIAELCWGPYSPRRLTRSVAGATVEKETAMPIIKGLELPKNRLEEKLRKGERRA
jgi:hypothetical protein